MKQFFLFLITIFILTSCGTSSTFSSSNLRKRKHTKGIFVNRKGNFKQSAGKKKELEITDETVASNEVESEAKPPENSIEQVNDQPILEESAEEEIIELNSKEDVEELIEESRQAFVSNRALKKELKKQYPNDRAKRKEEYRLKQDKLGFVGFVFQCIVIFPIFPFVGMILGAIALGRIKSEKTIVTGRKLWPLWALIGGLVGTLISTFFWILMEREWGLF